MSEAIRTTLICISLIFVVVGGYYRVQSQRSGERLDRTREGWPVLIAVRVVGLLALATVAAWMGNPEWFPWASYPVSPALRWAGVAGFAFSVAWLIWMFHALGGNLTDTVVTRRDSYFVDNGPYRYVRNPMYTGILLTTASLGLTLGTWLIPIIGISMFLLLALRTRTEEEYLIERFGDRYRAYMKRVGRFFPRLIG